ncbi:hypothetical protein BLNAU_12102 [Blattamonas nauphoetae]|uniref:Uncharacterized protein n=1 Tax=Blattamonas nauphoetae TaxID=2049346 RepID=A0ABQ9XKG7_9EUKA|nr:hypothetical protein BLNAU_12102 [Blattamonas nauphoetae]
MIYQSLLSTIEMEDAFELLQVFGINCSVLPPKGVSAEAESEGGVSFSLSGSASLVIQYCSFVSCGVGDGGRGGGVGLAFSSYSSHNYLLNTVTFAHNTASFGRDLFVVAESLEKTVAIDHFLFNLHPPGFDRSNALFRIDCVSKSLGIATTRLHPILGGS